LPVRGLFPKRQLLGENFHATSDFRPQFLRNDNKSRKVMTGCHAYGMLSSNSWMDQDVIWYGGMCRPRPHYVRWKPSSPIRGTAAP